MQSRTQPVMSPEHFSSFAPPAEKQYARAAMIEYIRRLWASPFLSSLILLAAGLSLLLAGSVKLPGLDTRAEQSFRNNLKTSLLTYGTLRTLNAVISFAQESEVAASPAGVGLTMAVGQILDPINDIVERGCNVLETSIMALGALNILQELSQLFAVKILGGFLAVASVCRLFGYTAGLSSFLVRVCLLLALVRFVLPVAALGNDVLDRAYFDQRIRTHQQNLEPFTSQHEPSFKAGDADQNTDFLDRLKDALNPSIVLRQVSTSYTMLKENAANIVSNTVDLAILFLGKLLFQVLLLPMAIFWLLLRTVDALFGTSVARVYGGKLRRTGQAGRQGREAGSSEGTA